MLILQAISIANSFPSQGSPIVEYEDENYYYDRSLELDDGDDYYEDESYEYDDGAQWGQRSGEYKDAWTKGLNDLQV